MTPAEHYPALSPLVVACALLYAGAAARVLWYRPNGSRHRSAVSLIASGIIAALACRSVALVLGLGTPIRVELVIAVAIFAVTWAARGNLARIHSEVHQWLKF